MPTYSTCVRTYTMAIVPTSLVLSLFARKGIVGSGIGMVGRVKGEIVIMIKADHERVPERDHSINKAGGFYIGKNV